MSEQQISDPVYVLIGTVITAALAGIGWLCKNKCRNQTCESNCGCFKFHSDSKIRQTVREEVASQLQQRSQSSTTEVQIFPADTD